MLLPVVPRPARTAEPGEGRFVLATTTPLRVRDAGLEAVAGQVARSLGLDPAPGPGADAVPALTLCLDRALAHPEAYELRLAPAGAVLAGGSPAGCFYALQTLLQLLPPEVAAGGLASGRGYPLAALSLRDGPHHNWRGMHLDCARHFFPVDFIKRYIDLLALHKMNRFHWHLTDDQGWRLEIADFPELTAVGAWRERTVADHTSDRDRRYRERPHGGYYSREQVREVVAHAAARQVEVVPEIDIPGHAAALLAARPDLACRPSEFRVESHFGIFPDVLCARESTFAFLEQVFGEVAGLFPGEYVHIGGDEVVKTAWRGCEHCQALIREQGLAGEAGLHGYFVSRVVEILARLGKRAIGWDEILEGGASPATAITCWNPSAGERALAAGHPVVMSPVDSLYFDFYQSTSRDEPRAIHGLTTLRRVYDYEPAGEGNLLGAQGNVWSEYLSSPEAVCRAALPRMSALAEALWHGPGRDWADFCRRLPPLLARFDSLGLPAARSVFKPLARPVGPRDGRLRVALDCEMPGVAVHYTTDGSAPGPASPRCEGPLTLEGELLLRAVGVDPEGRIHGDEGLYVAAHRGLHKPLYHVRGEELVAAPELALLTNGCRGGERIFHYHEWVEFDCERVDIALDLERPERLSTLAFNLEAGAHRRLARPAALALLGSVDGRAWRPLAALAEAEIPASGPLALPCGGEALRYLRLQLDNSRLYYSPETRREQRMPLYLDELVVT